MNKGKQLIYKSLKYYQHHSITAYQNHHYTEIAREIKVDPDIVYPIVIRVNYIYKPGTRGTGNPIFLLQGSIDLLNGEGEGRETINLGTVDKLIAHTTLSDLNLDNLKQELNWYQNSNVIFKKICDKLEDLIGSEQSKAVYQAIMDTDEESFQSKGFQSAIGDNKIFEEQGFKEFVVKNNLDKLKS